MSFITGLGNTPYMSPFSPGNSEDIAKRLENFYYNIQMREAKVAQYEDLLKQVFNQRRLSEGK